MSAGDPLPDGSHGPHVLVDDLDSLVISDDDRHHLDRVLRIRHGDPMTIGDGRGGWQPYRWGLSPHAVGERRMVAPPDPRAGVAFALIKGGRPELVVQKLTELGIDDIRPFVAARSIVRWDAEKASRNRDRFDRVAREAVMQCRRAWVPTVHEVTDFDGVCAVPDAAMADMGGMRFIDEAGSSVTTLLIGPEGGWDDGERAAEIPRVSLSAAVLRAETAAIAAGVVLAARHRQ